MDRFVMRNDLTGGIALIPESSVQLHKAQGWVRVSEAVAEQDMDRVDLRAYRDAPDLDPVPEPAPEPVDEPAAHAAPAAPAKSAKTRER